MIICIDPREIRSSWASLGIPTSESGSLREGHPDPIASGSVNLGDVSGNCPHAPTITPKLMDPSGSGSLLRIDGGMQSSCPLLLGLWFPPSNTASSVGIGEATNSSSTTSGMEASTRSSLSISGSRHLQRSWMVPQSMPGGAPNSSAHHWMAGPVQPSGLSFTTWMSLGSWGLGGEGRKSWHPKPTRLGRAFHQLDFFL